MTYARLATRLYNRPHLITPEKLAIIEYVFRKHAETPREERTEHETYGTIDAHIAQIASQNAAKRTDAGYLLTRAGVAIIPVIGTLVQRADSFDAMSGMLGYNRIGAQISDAVGNRDVKSILLEIDSPGGEANGCFELCKRILQWREQKPLWAIANEQAFSAAYAIAASASKLYMPEPAMVGSVGVVALHVDQSKLDKNIGLDFTYIFAGKKKVDGNPHEPLSERAASDYQDEVDRLYGLFCRSVATARGISVEAVKGTEAGLLTPTEAIALGMADGVASFPDTLSLLASSASNSTSRASAHGSPEVSMNQQGNETGAPAAAPAPTFTQAQLDAAVAAARNEAATAERARIAGILRSEAANGRTGLATHIAFESEMSPEQAAALMQHAPTEAAPVATPAAGSNLAVPQSMLDAAMRTVPNPNVRADVAGTDAAQEGEPDPALIAKVVSLHSEAHRRQK